MAWSLIVLLAIVVSATLALALLLLARLAWTGDRMGLVVGLAIGVVMVTITTARTISRRLRSQAWTPRSTDPRAPVLYLRSFGADQTALTATDTREEHLTSALEEIGPVVAIGRPGDRLAPGGAARTYVPDDTWQREVSALLRSARLVVIQVGVTPGLRWELKTAVQLIPPERLLISLRRSDAPISWSARRTAERDYERFRSETAAVFPRGLPPTIGTDATFLCFESDWTPRLLRPKRWRPYNLSAPVKVRETLRPVFASRGVEFRRAPIVGQAVLMSLLLFLCTALVAGAVAALIY